MTDTPTSPDSVGTPSEAAALPQEYVADVSFEEMGLSEPLRRAIAERGYSRPTPVQARAFAPVVAGKDLIVRSKTGTGKTAAFSIPVLERISEDERRVRALVLCPTRELAIQVAEEAQALGKHKGIKVATIYGGSSMKTQEDALAAGAQFVVGTPGRVMDLIQRGILKLDACNTAILDEADEMLNQGFYEDVTRILDKLPKDRQVLLFSATVPADIQRLITRYTTDAETLLLSGDVYTVEHIHHIRYELSDAYPKPRNLIYALEMEQPENAIIFCNTRDDTTLVNAVLNRNGFDSEVLNGDLPQKERERVMAKVKRGEVAFMVATDIAARGIDISGLGWVINYSLPEDPAVYLHRVGRTGRIGKKGTAVNLTSGRELSTLTVLERKFNIKFERRQMPTPEEASRMWSERHVREIREESGHAVYEGHLGLAAQLKGRPDADDLIAFLLKYFFTHLRMERARRAMEAEGREPAEPKEEERPRERKRERERDRERKPERREERVTRARDERTREDRERERKAPRRDERRRGPVEAGPGEVKLWLNVGTMGGLDEAGFTRMLEEAGAPADKVVRSDLRPTFSYLVVAETDAAAFETLTGKSHGAQVLKVERSRPRGERGEERPRPVRSPEAGPGEVKFQVNVGSADGLDDDGFKQVLAGAGAPVEKLNKVLVRERYAYAFVAEADAQPFEDISGRMWQGRTLTVERRLPLPQLGEAPRREHRREPREPAVEVQPGQARVWLNLGRADQLDAAGVTQALEALGAPAGSVAHVDLRQTFSYLHVPEEQVAALEGLAGKSHGDKTLKLERARPPR
ncbi:MAG: DEAD/DEAH box helicase [Myxococcaceae bacterium]|nr:DEAD/DEAH box helicase [Myxococcaceae bacterium]MCI0668843.1 DEAD/DEAH box helicase [Myxococcaceae bacterium]